MPLAVTTFGAAVGAALGAALGALLAAVLVSLIPRTAGAQGAGVVNLVQAGPAQSCTFQPSAYAPTCPIADGAAVLASGATVTTVRSAAEPGGVLRVATTLEVTNGTAQTYQAFGRAGYFDALTIAGSGEAAYARFAVAADGVGGASTDFAAVDPAWTPYGILFIANYGTASVPASYGTGPSPGVHQLLVPPNAGTLTGFIEVPVRMGLNNLLIAFSAVARVGRPTSVPAGGAWSGSATADYANTAYLTGMTFLDAQRRDVTSQVTASFASGALATVPEPGPWALCATGLLALGAVARRRRRAAVRRLAAAVVALAAGAPAARAQTTPSGTSTLDYVWQWTQVASTGARLDAYLCLPSPQPVDGSCGRAGVHATATGSAAGGLLRAGSSLTLTAFAPQLQQAVPVGTDSWGITATGSATLWDAVTFAPGGEVPDLLRFTYAITGTTATAASSGQAFLQSTGTLTFGATQRETGGIPSAAVHQQQARGFESQTLEDAFAGFTDVPLVGATPLRFTFGLLAISTAVRGLDLPMSGTVTTDYTHTVRVGVRAFRDGVDVTDRTSFVFASGTAYATTVPEPGTWVLLGTGLLVSGAVARRRRPLPGAMTSDLEA